MSEGEVQQIDPGQIERRDIRDRINAFEDELAKVPGAVFGDNDIAPVTHKFCDGFYMRQMFLPKGTYMVGKIHRHEHPTFIMSGRLQVVTETTGLVVLEAPQMVIAPPGTKRLGYAIEDTVLVTVHLNPTNTQDIDELEKINVVKSYDELTGDPVGSVKELV